jgi:hypothetical protein
MMKKIDIVEIIFAVLVLWMVGTSVVCWFKAPKLTQMEVFQRIPQSFRLDFEVVPI